MSLSTPQGLRAAVIVSVLGYAASAQTGAAQRRVDIGGYRLNVSCTGSGSPTVILDAGAGDTLSTWDWVAPEVRRFTRVCAYDRAGLGRSDPGPLPRTSERIVEELHLLLSRARIPGPYVLVGHSFGGLNVRLYASRYSADVAGVVLVDATPEDFPRMAAVMQTRAENLKLTTSLGMASDAFRSELLSMADSAEIVRAASPADRPVVVLTAARGEDGAALRSVWEDLQRRMTSSFSHARQVIVDESGHYIQFDQPELVVEAIRELVDAARTARPDLAAAVP